MDICFKDDKIRKLCENGREAVRRLGADNADKLRKRLAELEAAETVADLVTGHPHPLKGGREGQFSLRLAGGCRLVFAPHHESIPSKPDGGVDWAQVNAVYIEYIGDYHE